MGFSIWHLLLTLLIVLVLFGAKRLRNIGSDLGSAVKGFKEAVREDRDEQVAPISGKVIEGEVSKSRDRV